MPTKHAVEFQSKGVTCRGDLTIPDGAGPHPVVVMAGGWCYVKEIVMPHYASYIQEAGLATLIFDYRCLGASDGEPRQHLDPWDQIEDYKNAISFVETHPELDENRIAAWGISYSGGHVLILGAIEPRIKCIVSNIPVVDGYANQRRVQGEERFIKMKHLLLTDRRARYENEANRGTIPFSSEDWNTLSVWPFADVFNIFKKIKETEAPRHEHWSTIESEELLLNYTVFPYTKRILNIPTMMVVAEGDEKTLWDLEIEAFNSITANNKRLEVLPAVSHMSLYSTRSHLEVAGTAAAKWLAKHLAGPGEPAPVDETSMQQEVKMIEQATKA
jgi:pimeloyl-ACP methyl ester carboxylesterase